MNQARERIKRQMATEKKRRENARIASSQKVFDGPHECTKCEKEFYSREFVEDVTKAICCSCKRKQRKR